MFIHPVNIIIFLAIVAAVSLGWIALQSRSRRRDAAASLGSAEPELSAMRNRIKVLERIVTDPSEQLDREIENLRHQA